MTWIDDTIGEFGRGLGLPRLALNEEAVLNLRFERSGTLYIERAEGGVIVYLARGVPAADERWPQSALELCHQRWPMPVKAGLRGDDTLVLLTRIAETDLSAPALESALALLAELHDKVRQ